jgi:hypothetical protein
MADARQLARIARVRDVQFRLAQADEARAQDKQASETRLAARIAQLAADVAPAPATVAAGVSFAAAAHYRTRLQQSAAAADARVRTADEAARRAADATRDARRDQSAVEKLHARALADDAARAIRAAADALPSGNRKRHDPC